MYLKKNSPPQDCLPVDLRYSPLQLTTASRRGNTSLQGFFFSLSRVYFSSVTPEILTFTSHRCAFNWGIWTFTSHRCAFNWGIWMSPDVGKNGSSQPPFRVLTPLLLDTCLTPYNQPGFFCLSFYDEILDKNQCQDLLSSPIVLFLI